VATTALIMSIALAVLSGALGAAKVFREPQIVARTTRLGFSVAGVRAIGALELSATVGLIAGLFWSPLRIAAAVGLTALLIGAVIAHLRAGDAVREAIPAIWVGVLAAATAILTLVAG
jgi:DoxX-like family